MELDEMTSVYLKIIEDISVKMKEMKLKKEELNEVSESIKNTMVSREIDKVQLKGGSLRIKVEKKTSGITKKLFESFLDKALIVKLYEGREIKETVSLKYEIHEE